MSRQVVRGPKGTYTFGFDPKLDSRVYNPTARRDEGMGENPMGCPNGGAGEDRFVGDFPLDDPDDDEVVDPPAFEGERDLRHPAGKMECWKCGGKIRGEYLQEDDGSRRHVNACPPVSRHMSVSRFIAECDADELAQTGGVAALGIVGENRPNGSAGCEHKRVSLAGYCLDCWRPV